MLAQKKSELHISLARESDKEQISKLREDEYARASGFKVNPEAVRWNRSDDQCAILAVWDGSEVISTMRIELVDNQTMLETKLECPWEFGEISYPVMLLSKAATRLSHQGRGLNAAMRYHSLLLAKRWGVQYLVGTFVDGSPRRNTMARMGYQFFINKKGWFSSDYHSEREVIVAKLDLVTEGKHAVSMLERAGSQLIWQGEIPKAKFVRLVK